MVEKTFSMVYRDTKNSIVNIINQSKLPPDALLTMMENMVMELKAQADAAYIQEMQAYNAKVEAEKQEEEKSE